MKKIEVLIKTFKVDEVKELLRVLRNSSWLLSKSL